MGGQPLNSKQQATKSGAVDRYLSEIEYIRSYMAESQKRTERLRAETSGVLAETRQVLSKLAV